MSASLESDSLPSVLRTLRVGTDDNLQIRRAVHLAAAKIEDLEDQVARLADALRRTSAGQAPSHGGRKRGPRIRRN